VSGRIRRTVRASLFHLVLLLIVLIVYFGTACISDFGSRIIASSCLDA
jgi:hypothetical protein